MGAAAPKPLLAIPPHSKLWGFSAFSREVLLLHERRSGVTQPIQWYNLEMLIEGWPSQYELG